MIAAPAAVLLALASPPTIAAEVIGGDAAGSARVARSVARLLDRHGLAAAVDRRASPAGEDPAPPAAGARLVIDLRDGAAAEVRLANGGADPLVRTVPLPRGLDDLAVEAIVQVIDPALTLLGDAGAPAAPPPPPVPARPPAVIAARPERLGGARHTIEVHGSLRLLAPGTAPARGLGAAVLFWVSPVSGVFLGLRYELPARLLARDARALVSTFDGTWGLFQRGRGARLWWEASSIFGLELSHVRPAPVAGAPVEVVAPYHTFGGNFGGAFGVAARLGPLLSLRAAVEVVLHTFAFDLARGPGDRSVGFTTWMLGPALVVGARWP